MEKRLVELIKHCTSCEECRDEDIAAHLIANGVFVPLCKIGDPIYMLIYDKCECPGERWYVSEPNTVTNVSATGFYTDAGFTDHEPWYLIGDEWFLSEEEAQKLANERNALDRIKKE